jgi:uncharacterized repeat protein (TIGR01451 family)
MRKYLAILALIFALAIYVSIQNRRSTAKATQQGAPPTNTIIAAESHDDQSDNHTSNTERNSPTWYRLFAWPEGITTWAIILTLLAVAEQARESAKATQAVRDSLPHQERAAKAALLNAQAVVSAERAWIIPELKSIYTQKEDNRWYRYDGVPLTTEEVLRGDHLKYIVKLTNMGRTPANVTGFQVSYTLLPAGVTDLPPNAAGNSTSYRAVNQFIAAGGSAEILEPVIDVGIYTKGHWLPIRALEETAVFHGWVKYRHMFSAKEDQADFCYVYTVSVNRLSSVDGHTKYTQQDDPAN